jgi:hypothetical protein
MLLRVSFLLVLTLVAAQSWAQRGWVVGVEISPSYYTMLNDMDQNADPLILAYADYDILSAPRGWAGGFKAFYGFTESLGLQTGLRYSWGRQDYTHGRGDVPSGGTDIGTISTELNYLQIPILFSWNTENESELRFYVSAGVAPAWLAWFYELNAKTYNSAGLLSTYEIKNTPTTRSFYGITIRDGVIEDERSSSTVQGKRDMYNNFNLFLAAETGLRVPLNRGWQFNVALTYYQSLLNPDNIDSYRWEDDKYTRNEVPPTDSNVEYPTKYDRPKTTLLSIGLSLGLLYEFDW